MLSVVRPDAGSEAVAVGLTLFIETPVYMALLCRILGVRCRVTFGAAVAVILVEHPLAFLLVGPVLTAAVGGTASLAIVEVGIAWFGEAALLWLWLRHDPGQLMAVSFVANALSFGLGLILFAI
jgi:hypothetical protein